MALEKFTWCPRVNASAETSFRVRKAQFGDGYAQTATDGINARSAQWSVEFTGTDEYIRPIMQFLDRHKGARAFVWSPPLGNESLWRADRYSLSALGLGQYTVTTTFSEAYAP